MPFDDIRCVFAYFPPSEGWTCKGATNYSVTLYHESVGAVTLIKWANY